MLALLVLISLSGSPQVDRSVATVAFPTFKNTSDVDDIMDDYPAYLAFILDIGQDVNPTVANQIQERFNRLKKADEKLAARFLKGLRFEMIQKMELSGLTPRNTTSNNATMRKWVQRYLGVWLREVDEYQFRAFAAAIARRQRLF